MRIQVVFTLVACALGMTFSSTLRGEIKVEPDKENIVASRLEGDWQLDVALTKRLIEEDTAGDRALAVSFKSDPAVAGKIPAEYEKFFGNKKVYLAGVVTFKGRGVSEHVFILIEHRGNPLVAFFRGGGLGAKGFYVMLAVAQNQRNDLLFIGGDLAKKPFSAYARVKVEKK